MYFKNGNQTLMKNENIEERLHSIIGKSTEEGLQNQFKELIKTVCTSIKAVNSEYASAVFVISSNGNG